MTKTEIKAEFDEVVENHSRQEILSLLGEAEPPRKMMILKDTGKRILMLIVENNQNI